MRHLRTFVVGLICASMTVADSPAPVGTRVPEFAATDAITGKLWSLTDSARDAKVVVVAFLGTECPISNQYVPTLDALHKRFADRGVAFVAVNSVPQDDAATVAKHAKSYALPFPVLKDADQSVADKLKAARVPEAFVLDGTRTVRYRGRIDDQYGRGVYRPAPTRTDLADAITAVVEGKEVAAPATEVVGCPLSKPDRTAKAPTGPVYTFTKDVLPVLQKHCQECHRPGEIGPFSLLTYKQAKAWADAIREAVTDSRMPPWHADPAHGSFRNERRLSDAERKALLGWIDQGCAKGNDGDAPPARTFTDGWQMGTPDEVLTLGEAIPIPAQAPRNGMPYQYRLLGEPFKEDRWVRGSEVRPGDRGVVHHVLLFARPPHAKPIDFKKPVPDQLFNWVDIFDKDLIGNGLLGAYVPGSLPAVAPDGMAMRVKKGTQLVLELHYTPNGRKTEDRVSVGFLYSKEKPKHEIRDRSILNNSFVIEPFAENHQVKAHTTFDKDAVLLAFAPHMHLRGKDFEYILTTPGGKPETLLRVPKYDFNWQMKYELTEPRRIPKGSRIDCVAHFDNSRKNPNNPDPSKRVGWGDQTFQEMMIGFVDYYYPE
ncbi:MAG TPA: redoxin domain-containing protein [Gemmataceae bacterium]|nr:redoxin domain-containing protein [Gemmataceae bacterium]